MGFLDPVPEWLLTALVAAAFSFLGFFARRIYDSLETRRARKRNAIAELQRLKSLLQESGSVFLSQRYQAGRLYSLLKEKFGAQVSPGLGLDETFYRMYDKMDDEHLELFKLIRGTTMNSMRRVNESLRDWTEKNTGRQLVGESTPAIQMLDEQLGQLKAHLNGWFDKYSAIFSTSEKRSLVYLADEKRHGVGFPQELEGTVNEVLRELSL